MTTTRELLIATYANFNARDIDSVLAIFHRDVDWPNGMEGGRVYGHSGVREYWIRQWKLVDPHVEPVSFSTEKDGRTAVAGPSDSPRSTGERSTRSNSATCLSR